MSTSLEQHKRDEHQIGHLAEFMKQIVYGGNDGIVTTFAVVAGFAGAKAEGVAEIGGIAVLLFGFANLFADATAMGLGEFLSARSEQDVYRSTRRKELHEIRHNPAMERAETMEILTDKGFSATDARDMADIFQRNPEFMADFMMNYEIGMMDPTGESPGMNGFATFVAFLIFGVVPLVPYFFLPAEPATFTVSMWATFGALVALGLLRWRVTAETITRCVGETVLVGGTCAAVAYAVGVIFAL